jgi:hypothetical protein
MAILLDHYFAVRKRVQHASILHVAARMHHQPPEIAAQHRARPDEATRADDDIADQGGGRMHEGGGINDRNKAFKSKNRGGRVLHRTSCGQVASVE